jgi:hypothetical protein
MNWRRFLRRDAADSELRDELASYVELTAEEYVARGMSATEAKAAARRKLGNTTWIREEVYQMNSITFVESVLRDMRHALRMIRNKPGFSVPALLSLALGIGGQYRHLHCGERCCAAPVALSKTTSPGGCLQFWRYSSGGVPQLASFTRHVPDLP